MGNKKNGTLYVGVSSDLVKRVYEHKHDKIEGFTKKYKLHKLFYYEFTSDVHEAILREKRIKKWNRSWKIELIEKDNPGWADLYNNLIGHGSPI